MKKYTVVVADDDAQMRRLITTNLQMEGYQVTSVTNGEEALQAIEEQTPDLALLDVMMPKMDGFTVCEKVREFSPVPVIMITARGQDQDKVRGLDLGADDYLTKPFSVDELLARVRAVLRRSEFRHGDKPLLTPANLVIGDITVDFAQHRVMRSGQEVALTATEYNIFTYLIQNAGRVLTQNMLLEHVWGSEYVGEYHMLQVNINRLRRKIEPDPAHPRFIQTRPGVGYMFANLTGSL